MQPPHTLHAYDYVNHPYERVRRALVAGPKHVFRQATSGGVVDDAVLRVQFAGLEIGAEIAITVVRVEENEDGPVLAIGLAWQAAKHPGAFPTMTGTLRVFPLTPTETQLALEGTYVPPLGPVGTALDATVGHRFAEAAVAQFVREVAAYLREHLVDAAVAAPVVVGPAVPADTEC
jgi:hypothetical protein